MKRTITIILAMSLLIANSVAQPDLPDGWKLFARVKFTSKYYKSLNEYMLVPTFDSYVRSKSNTLLTLRGYYIPFDLPRNQLILSKNPYTSCFFCGAAGPESVACIILKTKAPKLKADKIVTVKGRLRLNETNTDMLNFILEEAEITEE